MINRSELQVGQIFRHIGERSLWFMHDADNPRIVTCLMSSKIYHTAADVYFFGTTPIELVNVEEALDIMDVTELPAWTIGKVSVCFEYEYV